MIDTDFIELIGCVDGGTVGIVDHQRIRIGRNLHQFRHGLLLDASTHQNDFFIVSDMVTQPGKQFLVGNDEGVAIHDLSFVQFTKFIIVYDGQVAEKFFQYGLIMLYGCIILGKVLVDNTDMFHGGFLSITG